MGPEAFPPAMPIPPELEDALTLFHDAPFPGPMEASLHEYAAFARDVMEPVAWEVDRRARPYLQVHDLLGADLDEVVLNRSHRQTLERMYRSGIATGPVEGRHPWWYSFALGYLTIDIGMFCSATVTMATVYSVAKYATPEVRERMLPLLLEGGAIRQGSTWATEAQGGSDLGANTTRASPGEDGSVRLTGEKYFCSNAGSEFAVATARPEGAPAGARGIRLYLVRSRRTDGSPNWRIRRLKDKLGTTAVPTGEMSLLASEAFPLGPPEAGIHPTMEMLNLSRICNSLGSAAQLARALGFAVEHAGKREAFGKRLAEHPLMAQDLARLAAMAEATTLLAFEPAFAFDDVWEVKPPYPEAYQRMRFATHAAKLLTAEQAVRETTYAMEILGGSGYLEEFPMAKLVRDTLVTPVWEGGANVQALDAVEVMLKVHPENAWLDDARRAIEAAPSGAVRDFLSRRIELLKAPPRDLMSSAKVRLRLWGEVREMTLMLRLLARLDRVGNGAGKARVQALAEVLALVIDGNRGEGMPLKLARTALGTRAQ